jgi:pyruvate/2-oxoglutarate dehydrogenase complex dihydrolipoamide acyltransferase (E2) component
MSTPIEIRLPDIGDFTGVPVIEVHVAPGDQVAVDDPILTLESDKATMDIPAPQAGTVRELRVGVGDEVSQGDVLMTLDAAGAEGGATGGAAPEHVTEEATPATSEPAGYGSPAGVYDRLGQGARHRASTRTCPHRVRRPGNHPAEDPLLTLSPTRPPWIPTPVAGTVAGVRVGVGDTVTGGDVIVELRLWLDGREQPPSESAGHPRLPPRRPRVSGRRQAGIAGARPGPND